jgi:hypothetical protein
MLKDIIKNILIKGAIFFGLAFILINNLSDFRRWELISEYYLVELALPDSSFSKYSLIPKNYNDLFYYQLASGNLWMKGRKIEHMTLRFEGIIPSGVILLLENDQGQHYYDVLYDVKSKGYEIKPIENLVNVVELKNYILFHIGKSVLILLVSLTFFLILDVYFLKPYRNSFWIIGICVSIILSASLVFLIYGELYKTLLS